jgi:DNA-binding HxlR family transcriptional regulator
MIDFGQIDKVIHEKARLSIMTVLASRKPMAFQDLKADLAMSDGNLITHLRTLMKAGYVEETRDDSGNRPRTDYAITSSGSKAFRNYIDVLEAIVKATKPD